MNTHSHSFFYTLVAAGVIATAACSVSPRREAEWVDPALASTPHLLRGARVLMVCDAYDATLIQICESQLSRELVAQGATAVAVPPGTALLNDRDLDSQLLQVARSVDARAVLILAMAPATSSVSPEASFGLGGFSFGGGGGVGVGLSVPVGGGNPGAAGYSAQGRVIDAESQRPVWAATFVAQPSVHLDVQFNELIRSMLTSAQRAGLF